MFLPSSCPHTLACLRLVFLCGAAETNPLCVRCGSTGSPLVQPLAHGVTEEGGGSTLAAPPNGTPTKAVLHATFSRLATFEGCSLGAAKKYLFNGKEKPYEKRWSRAVRGRVPRGTFQRALKIKSWSLETTLCVSAPHLCSSGGSSCRIDPPCPLLVLRTYVSSCSGSTTSLGFPVHHGLSLLPSSVWWDCDTEPLCTVTTWEFGALF